MRMLVDLLIMFSVCSEFMVQSDKNTACRALDLLLIRCEKLSFLWLLYWSYIKNIQERVVCWVAL